MSADERRAAILEAALPLFAQHGPNGVTTKQIADAAGVSEALLYKHFQNKEALYAELQQYCVHAGERNAMLEQLVPSTSTLVIGLYWLFTYVIVGGDGGSERNRQIRRLIITSILEDGAFARGFMQKNTGPVLERLAACIPAAQAAGDLHADVDPDVVSLWIGHAAAAGVAMLINADPPIMPIEKDGAAILPDLVRFVLRGIGLKEEAIERHLNPEAFTLLNSK